MQFFLFFVDLVGLSGIIGVQMGESGIKNVFLRYIQTQLR